MELAIINKEGQQTGKTIDLKDTIFAIEPNDHAIYLDVKQYMAANRQGTHKSKDRSEITGSTRKLKKQKGTGGARSGDIKSPVFIGGGRAFGPRPRDYDFKLNKKVKQLARKSALAYKAKENNIVVMEDFNMEQPKTKTIVEIKNKLNLTYKKLLIILPSQNKNLFLSSRNLEDTKVISINELNTYEILNASVLLFLESTLGVLQNEVLRN